MRNPTLISGLVGLVWSRVEVRGFEPRTFQLKGRPQRPPPTCRAPQTGGPSPSEGGAGPLRRGGAKPLRRGGRAPRQGGQAPQRGGPGPQLLCSDAHPNYNHSQGRTSGSSVPECPGTRVRPPPEVQMVWSGGGTTPGPCSSTVQSCGTGARYWTLWQEGGGG